MNAFENNSKLLHSFSNTLFKDITKLLEVLDNYIYNLSITVQMNQNTSVYNIYIVGNE